MTLDELQKLCDEATPGPWVYKKPWDAGLFSGDTMIVGGDPNHEDVKFIAAAREWMHKLIDAVNAAKNLRDWEKTENYREIEKWQDNLDAALKPFRGEG